MAKKSFEDCMAQLEKIVEALESGNLPLEQALKKFEEGMGLSRFCFDKLDESEQKISLLLNDRNGQVKKTVFETGPVANSGNEPDED